MDLIKLLPYTVEIPYTIDEFEPVPWCEDNFGPPLWDSRSGTWSICMFTHKHATYYFKSEQDAILFRLTWM